VLGGWRLRGFGDVGGRKGRKRIGREHRVASRSPLLEVVDVVDCSRRALAWD